jgi:proline iminopeptidase
MYDQRGAGRSEIIHDPARLTADDHVRDLEAVRAHFGLSRMILFGESWGSGLAALYASRHPQHVSRIVFLGPMPPTKELSKQRLDAVDAQTGLYKRMAELRQSMSTAADPGKACRDFFAAYLPPYFADPAAMSRRKGDSCNTAEEGIRNYIAVNDATIKSLGDWDFRPMLQKLTMPALVIEGEASRPTIAGAKAWAAALPHGRLVLVPKAGHFPQVENPSAFFAAVRAFLGAR